MWGIVAKSAKQPASNPNTNNNFDLPTENSDLIDLEEPVAEQKQTEAESLTLEKTES